MPSDVHRLRACTAHRPDKMQARARCHGGPRAHTLMAVTRALGRHRSQKARAQQQQRRCEKKGVGHCVWSC